MHFCMLVGYSNYSIISKPFLSKFLTDCTLGSRLNLMTTDPPPLQDPERSVCMSTINLFHMSKDPVPRSEKWLPVSCHLSSCTSLKVTQQFILHVNSQTITIKLTNFSVIYRCPETSGFKVHVNNI
jgi:hypothetical protein